MSSGDAQLGHRPSPVSASIKNWTEADTLLASEPDGGHEATQFSRRYWVVRLRGRSPRARSRMECGGSDCFGLAEEQDPRNVKNAGGVSGSPS